MYQFPYTDFHDLDLDWLITQMKSNNDNVATLTTKVDEFIKDFTPGNPRYLALVTTIGDSIQAELSNLITATNKAKKDAENAADAANSAAESALGITGFIAASFTRQTGDYYNIGAMCVYDGHLYKANKVTSSSTFISDDWDIIRTSALIIQNERNITELMSYIYQGKWNITTSDIEQGYYVRGVKTYNLARLRLRNMYHVKPGMILQYTIGTNLEMTLGTYPYNSQTGEYDVSQQQYPEIMAAESNGTYIIAHEGLLVIQFRAPDNTGSSVNISDYDANVTLAFSYINIMDAQIKNNNTAIIANHDIMHKRTGYAWIAANNGEYIINGDTIKITIKGRISFQYGRAANGQLITIDLMEGNSPSVDGNGLYDKMLAFVTNNPDTNSLEASGDYYTLSGENVAIVYDNNSDSISVTRMDYARQSPDRYVILLGHSYTSTPVEGLLIDSLQDAKLRSLELSITNPDSPYPNYFADEIDDIVSKIENSNMDQAIVIGFFTDPHYNGNGSINITYQNIKHFDEKYPIDLLICGGDLNSGNVSRSLTMRYTNTVTQTFRKAFNRTLFLTGNHDDNSYISNTLQQDISVYINAAARKASFGRFNAIKTSTLSGYNAGVIKYPDLNLMIVYLDTIVGGLYGNNNLYINPESGQPPLQENWGYDSTELSWFSSILNEAEDMHVVVFSHMPARSSNMAGSQFVQGSTEIITLISSFISNGGNFVGWFNGHTHRDLVVNSDGFYQISVGQSNCIENLTENTNTYGTQPARTVNTLTQDLWDVITINTRNRSVNAYRFGAGNDVLYTY